MKWKPTVLLPYAARPPRAWAVPSWRQGTGSSNATASFGCAAPVTPELITLELEVNTIGLVGVLVLGDPSWTNSAS
jgi:hypothetical protein